METLNLLNQLLPDTQTQLRSDWMDYRYKEGDDTGLNQFGFTGGWESDPGRGRAAKES